MIKFKKLTIRNFLSFGNKPIIIDLDKDNITLILGINKDVGSEGISRNGCVDKDTEFLTPTGWKKISEYDNGDLVAQYHKDTGKISFTKPDNYIKLPCDEFYHFKNHYGMDMMLSEEHRILYEKPWNGKLEEITAKDAVKKHEDLVNGFCGKIPTTFDYDGGTGIDLTDDELRVQVALMADGSFPSNYNNVNGKVVIRIKKERKKERLEQLLKKANIYYVCRAATPEGFVRFTFIAPIITKTYDERFWNCSKHQLEIIKDEVLFWDGCTTQNRMRFFSTSIEDVEFIQFVFSVCGYRSVINVDDYERKNDKEGSVRNICYNLTITKQNTVCIGNSKKPEIKTIKSVDGFKYCFSVPSTYLVLRRNSKIFVTGNCGKSTIFQAFMWVLYNEGITNIKQDDFINIINKKNMKVSLDFDIDDVSYCITRGRKPAVCNLTRNGEPYTHHSISNVDDAIEELVGMNSETFLNAYMLSTNTVSFMNLKPTAQKKFLDNMFSMDLLMERADKLKSKNKENAIEIKLEEQNKTHIERNFDTSKNNIIGLKEKEVVFLKKRNDDIIQAENDYHSIDSDFITSEINIIKENETNGEEIKTVERSLNSIETEKRNEVLILNQTKIESESLLKDIYTSDIKTIEDQKVFDSGIIDADSVRCDDIIANEESGLKEIHDNITKYTKELEHIIINLEKIEKEKEQLESSRCPYCEQKYHDSDEKLDDIIQQIKGDDKLVAEIKNELSALLIRDEEISEVLNTQNNSFYVEIKKRRVVVDDIHNKASEEINNNFDTEMKLIMATHEVDVSYIDDKFKDKENEYKNIISKLKSDIKESTFSLQECHVMEGKKIILEKKIKELKEDDSNPYIDQIKIISEGLVEYDDTRLKELKKNEEYFKMLIKMLTDNKSFVRKNLLDNYIPFINQKVNVYLEKLESLHRVHFNNDLSIDIEYMRNKISFGNLSRGEATRLSFSVSMAFRDFLSMSNHSMNILMIDEYFDNGIDSAGMHSLWNILREKEGESIFVITHREELLSEADEIMNVTKENGFSHIGD